MNNIQLLRLNRSLVALAAVVLLAAGALAGGEVLTRADNAHDHGDPEVELLTGRSTSPDAISAQLRLKLDGTGRTHVMNMNDVDRLLLAKLTFGPGDIVDWHTHPGPVIVIVAEGVLTVTTARDCVARDYGPDEVYIEQGPGDVLKVQNETDDTTVIYALFFEIPAEGPLTIQEDDPGC
jgi:quercetin dioxygenase-like cupin family protein